MPPTRIVALFTPVVAVDADAAARLAVSLVAGLSAAVAPAALRFERLRRELERVALDTDLHAAAVARELDRDAVDRGETARLGSVRPRPKDGRA